MNIPVGEVAVRSSGGRVLRHLMKQTDLGLITVCGRYMADRILPEDEQILDTTPLCQVCGRVLVSRLNQPT